AGPARRARSLGRQRLQLVAQRSREQSVAESPVDLEDQSLQLVLERVEPLVDAPFHAVALWRLRGVHGLIATAEGSRQLPLPADQLRIELAGRRSKPSCRSRTARSKGSNGNCAPSPDRRAVFLVAEAPGSCGTRGRRSSRHRCGCIAGISAGLSSLTRVEAVA